MHPFKLNWFTTKIDLRMLLKLKFQGLFSLEIQFRAAHSGKTIYIICNRKRNKRRNMKGDGEKGLLGANKYN